MTAYLVDVSRWQVERPDPLDLSAAAESGFTLVNLQLSGSNGYRPGPWLATYTERARELGMGICCYWWLDNSASGAHQAGQATAAMMNLGGTDGMAHQVDCESNATRTIWLDYVNAMQDTLGRHVVNYSGDWWWRPRGWNGAALTPYHWAAPNEGYPGVYPGDSSTMWQAGYGGWETMSVMQYAVTNMPGTKVRCSLSAIRDPLVWRALTGEVTGPVAWFLNPALTQMRREVNAAYPRRDRASDGTIGDEAHQNTSSSHNPDPDGSVDAWDMDVDLNGPGGASAAKDITIIKSRFQAHPSSSYWIHNDRISFRSEGWVPRSYAYAGPSRNRHEQHVHWNTRESHENVTTPFGIEDDMELTDVINLKTDGEVDYSSPTSTVGSILASTNYYVLVLRKRLAEEKAMIQGLQTAAAAQAAAIEKLTEILTDAMSGEGGGIDSAAIVAQIRAHIDAKIAELPTADETADAVVAEIAS